MSEDTEVTIRYTGRGPNLHRDVSPEELSQYDLESGPWEIKDKDAFVKESDSGSEIAEAASAAFRERATDMHGSNAWEGVAEELEADYNLSDDDEERSDLHIQPEESWSQYRQRLKDLERE